MYAENRQANLNTLASVERERKEAKKILRRQKKKTRTTISTTTADRSRRQDLYVSEETDLY